jgi:predicted pyridoxine 5'-phosphate oxidase superfamily flavin-nucleotide-binding protein
VAIDTLENPMTIATATAAAVPSDIAFTSAVKAIQARKGSRAAYAKMESGDGWQTTITDDLAAFIAAQTSFLLATANADGQPYVQHRGGPPGFLHVVDEKTLAFADFRGNRQYITQGNLTQNPKAFLFLIDYAHRRRVKIWGEARVVEDPALAAKLMPPDYNARAEQTILFTVSTWNANCPQHIPQRFDAADVAATIAARERRIAELESEVALLKAQVGD